MKIALDQIRETPRVLSYAEDVDALNRELARGAGDFRLADHLLVDVSYHRAGLDVFFDGAVRGAVQGCCARCLAEYRFPLEAPLAIVLTPKAAAPSHSRALREEDIGLSVYEGDEIDLTPLVHEQTILALPTRPLCAEECRGLCPRCGANLNAGPCGCPTGMAESRLAALETLLRGR
jgi:uncharacterized protein